MCFFKIFSRKFKHVLMCMCKDNARRCISGKQYILDINGNKIVVK